MLRFVLTVFVVGLWGMAPVGAGPLLLNADRYGESGPRDARARSAPAQLGRAVTPARYAHPQPPNLGGGFIEFIFGGFAQPSSRYPAMYVRGEPAESSDPAHP